MGSPVITTPTLDPDIWTDPLDSIPILYEDEEEDEMGEASYHVETDDIFHVCLDIHLRVHFPDLRAFANMNLYYKKDGPLHPVTRSLPYVSPDTMVVRAYQSFPQRVSSFTIGKDGPAPLLVSEVLSKRSAQQRDLHEKLAVYSKLGVAEYVLMDPAGLYLPEQLLLKRLQANGTWLDIKDPDGGITSLLGFKVIVDEDGEIRLLDQFTGEPYVRPKEGQAEAKARQIAEESALDAADELMKAQLQAKTETEARRLAEQNVQVEAMARRQAEQQVQTEANARRLAEQLNQAEAMARRQAEQQVQTGANARRQAEQQVQIEANARRLAEQHAQAEAEARRLAEENLKKLQEELDRLRGSKG